VFEAACSVLDGIWTQTQTSISDPSQQSPMYQRTNGEMLLSQFSADNIP
jgi:hypothetical protein